MMVHGSRRQLVKRKPWSSRRRKLHLEQLEDRRLLAAGFGKFFSPDTIGVGSVSTLTFDISNFESPTPISDLAFSDTLPTGVTIAAPANASSSCGGTLSAPNGGDTISFSGGVLGSNSSCSITVDVTSSIAGTHTNTSGDLTSSDGNGGSAVADLTVDIFQPGFTKSFSPDSIKLGDRSTLTFTIDNTRDEGGDISSLDFTDSFPTGMVVADPANTVTTCAGGTITAVPGSSVVSFSAFSPAPPVVGALESCTVSVDVVATGVGLLGNTSSQLASRENFGQSETMGGKAAAVLKVTVDRISLVKSYTDDPVQPGGTVNLQFTVSNLNRENPATAIAFDDDLDPLGLLTGLVPSGVLPASPCGAGSSLAFAAGTGVLSLTGGSLPAEGSCTFSVVLAVPLTAPAGSFENTTEPITAVVDGEGVTGNMATDFLFISVAPLLTKEFTNDPVGPGGTVSLEFTITNTDQNLPATDLAFTDELPIVIVDAVSPPTSVCNGGTLTFTPLVKSNNSGSPSIPSTITLTGASLDKGDFCTFTLDLLVASDAPGGSFPNITSEITANDETLVGSPATDTLIVVEGPRLTKEFTDDPVAPGGTANLQFTITYGDEETVGDAVDINFTDDLTFLTGLAATGLQLIGACDPDGPGGSPGTGTLSGTTLLDFSGGSLAPGESCTFSVALDVPGTATPGAHTNTTSNVTATVSDVAVTGEPASDDLQIASLTLTKEFVDDPVIAGDIATLRFTLDNASAVDATSVVFTDNLGNALAGLVAVAPLPISPCSATTFSGTSLLTFSGGSVPAGTSCSFDVSVMVPGGADDGTYVNRTSVLSSSLGAGDPATDGLIVNSTLLDLTKEFTDDPVVPGGTVNLEFTLTNQAAEAISTIAFTDDLDEALAGLVATGLPISACGGAVATADGGMTIGLTGGSLAASGAAGDSCTFSLTLLVPVGATPGTTATNITSEVTGLTSSELPVNGDPAIDVLEVIGSVGFSKAFDGPTTATGTPVLTFTITNSSSETAASLAFSDNLDAVITGLVATNLPLSDVCGAGSLLSGTSLLMLTGGELGPMSSCTFNVELLVPATATAGTFPNTTSDLSQSGLIVAGPATADLLVEPPPTFAKSFAPDTIEAGAVSTLTFTIDNSASAVAASNLSFIDNFPAGVVIADPTNASSTCSGMGDASAGASSFSFAGGSVGAGASCTVKLDVTSSTAGTYVNTTGDLTSSSGNSGTASDTLTVTQLQPPTFSKSFAPDAIALNETSTLTFTIDNTANAVPASSLDFTDNLPEGIVIAATPNASTDCTGGVLIAAAGSLVIDYSGGSVAAGASCTVQVDVTGASVGSHDNTSEDLTSSLGNSGSASDTLTVQALSFDKSFLPDVIGVGSVSTLNFEIVNLSNNPVSNLAFTDNLPSGVTIAAPANASSSCGGAVSASNGGSTIGLSAGGIGPASSCLVTVDVMSSIADTYTNVTSQLQSSAGNATPATADLIVSTDRPGFTKSFSPDSINLGVRSTLTFTIDNSQNEGSSATELDFTDNLPSGIVIAAPANASTTCSGGVLTAVPGTDVISYASPLGNPASVGALASCTVSVDVIGGAVGVLGNTSGELTSLVNLGEESPVSVSSGKASAVLEVAGGAISLIKSFTDDPVPPGGTVTTQFVISNLSRDESATNIAFTDDLNATLSGLAAVGLPLSDVCGAGSELSGTSLLTLSGASLGPGEACTFSTTLQVPAAAATGVYTNTTSSITADVGGRSITGAPGSDDLFVQTAPILTKSFTDDPVGAGGAVNLSFNIQNTSTTSSAEDIAFTDALETVLMGLTVAMLPPAGFCGAGSSLTAPVVDGQPTLIMTGGNLPAGGSCSFDVTLLIPAGAAGGTFTNTTSEIAAVVDDVPLTGNPASDDLVVVAAPRLRKEFTDDPVLPGANANLQFTLIYDGEGVAGDATNINFTDDLNAALAGLAVVGLPINDICGTGSQLSGATNLSFTGGSLTPGSSCTFSIPVKVPLASLPGSFTNETSNVTATVDGATTMNVPATGDLRVAGLSISKEFTNDPVPAGGTVTLQFTIDNVSQVADATDITFTDNLDDTLAGLVATGTPQSDVCGAGSQLTGTSELALTGGNLAAGESCTFSVTVQVPASAASDMYTNTTSNLEAVFGATPVSLSPATDTLIVASGLLFLDKSFIQDSAFPGDAVTLDFTITNLDTSQSVTGITFTDDLDAALAGLVAVGLPASGVCGAGSQLAGTSLLTLTGGTLGPGASCSFSTTLQLPVDISFGSIVSNTTSQATGDLGGLQVTGDPASDELQIDFFKFSKSFDGLTYAGGTPKLTFTIENLAETAVSDVSFSDDLGAVIPGLAAIGLPATGVCGAGSQLAGTTLLTFTGGNLGPGGSCTFDVTLQVPTGAAAGTFTNVTSDLLVGGTAGAGPAVDSLTVIPPPDFDKAFTPAGIPLTGTSTLSFSINNSASPLGATGLTFTDNLPAGVTVAVPPNASTTCAGGILTATAGSSVITYSGGAVAAGASCSVHVDVTSVLSGSHLNVSGDLTSLLGNSGPASATLISQIMLMGGPFTPGVNILTTSKGLSDAIAILVKGTQPGNAQLTVQGVTFTTAFADPVVVAFAETDVDGTATFVLIATEAQVGQTLQYQAVQILPALDVSVVLSVPVVDAPLLAAGGQAVLAQGESAGGNALTPAMLRSVAAKAVERWEGMGLTQAEIDLLHSVTVKIADLSAGLLGQLVGTTISIDYSAADHGWFVDGTLGDSAEFGTTLSQTESGADAGGPADQRMDLFTAVLHEFGHVLKFEDTSPNQSLRGVMTAELPTGIRRLPKGWQNPSHLLDVNDDGSVSPLDALIVINEVNAAKFRDLDGRLPSLVPQGAARRFFDTNGDGFASALDALRIINRLNSIVGVTEGEAPPRVVDLALLDLQVEQRRETEPAPRKTVSVDNANRDAQLVVLGNVYSRAKERGIQFAASDAKSAESDLALLEWLEQQSSDGPLNLPRNYVIASFR